MFFGLTFEKVLVLGVIAAVIIGPERLPEYTRRLSRLVARVRSAGGVMRARVRHEVGDEFDDLDWRRLDPRQYDPRRIIREALDDGGASAGAIPPGAEKAPEASAPISGARPPSISPSSTVMP